MTLLFLERDDEVLLAMKKRGFGKHRWNGVGGKVDPGETIEQALVRESQEEISVTPKDYRQVALLVFDAFFKNERTKLLVHVFFCNEWEGKPTESEEMNPRWFKKPDIPYDEMWEDDILWLPQVLGGKLVVGRFVFDENDKVVSHEVREVDSIG